MSRTLMIQGTMSNAGKSLLTAGILRLMKEDGYSAAPFKSQNMALNSYITREGLEMALAQAGPEGIVCACGSLYMLGEVRHLLGLC